MRYGYLFFFVALVSACQPSGAKYDLGSGDEMSPGTRVDMGNDPNLPLAPFMVYEKKAGGVVVKNGSAPEGLRDMGKIPLEVNCQTAATLIVLQNNSPDTMKLEKISSTDKERFALTRFGGNGSDTILAGRETAYYLVTAPPLGSMPGKYRATIQVDYRFDSQGSSEPSHQFTFEVQSEVVEGQLVYVSPSGDDSADGLTRATAKRTIQAAIEAMKSNPGGRYTGRSLLITEGKYLEQVYVDTSVSIYGEKVKGCGVVPLALNPPATLKSNPPGSTSQDLLAIAGKGVQVKLSNLTILGEFPSGCGESSALGVYDGASLDGLEVFAAPDQRTCTRGTGLMVRNATANLIGTRLLGHHIGVDLQPGGKLHLSFGDFGFDRGGVLPDSIGLKLGNQAEANLYYSGSGESGGCAACRPSVLFQMEGVDARLNVAHSDFTMDPTEVLLESAPSASGKIEWLSTASKSTAGFRVKGELEGFVRSSRVVTKDWAVQLAVGPKTSWKFDTSDLSYDGSTSPDGRGILVTGGTVAVTKSNFLGQMVAVENQTSTPVVVTGSYLSGAQVKGSVDVREPALSQVANSAGK